jgi:hypothetical protein
MRRTIEDVLVEAGLLTEGQLRHVRHFARQHGVCLARAAIEQGGVDEEAMAAAIALQLRLPRLDLQRDAVDDDAVREVPYDLAEARRLLPLTIERGDTRRVIRIAMADPLDFDATEEIEMSTGCTLELLVGRVSEIGDAVMRHYRGVITKMIPRRPMFASALPESIAKSPEPGGQQLQQLADEVPADIGLQALIEILSDRGLIDRDTWLEAVSRLLRERARE